jgi:Phosphatidylglycerophosphate synthase
MGIVNIPNVLTATRIAVIPLLSLMIWQGGYRTALFIFIVTSLTDLLDGFFARLLKQMTVFGVWFDPFADKLFFLSLVVILTIKGQLPIWFTSLLLFRDVAVVAGSILSYYKMGSYSVKPHITGKLVILFLFIIILLTLTNLAFSINIPHGILLILSVVCLILSFSSFLYYFTRYLRNTPSTL